MSVPTAIDFSQLVIGAAKAAFDQIAAHGPAWTFPTRSLRHKPSGEIMEEAIMQKLVPCAVAFA
jgi:hypothetical protein